MAGSVPEDSVYGAINHRQPCLDFGLVTGRRRRQEGGVARGPGLLHYQSATGFLEQWERPVSLRPTSQPLEEPRHLLSLRGSEPQGGLKPLNPELWHFVLIYMSLNLKLLYGGPRSILEA